MSTLFQIDEEIDRLVEKFSEQLRDKLKKAAMRSEKIVLKQYIASQKETTKTVKDSYNISSSKSSNFPPRKKEIVNTSKRVPRREKDYSYASSSSDSD